MRYRLPFAGSLLLTALLAAPVWANRAPPPRPVPPPEPPKVEVVVPAEPKANGRLTIEARDDVNVSRLQIPKAMLAQLAGEKKPAAAAGGERSDARGRINTMVAGGALSMAFALGGLWLFGTGRGRKLLAVVIGCAGIGGAALMADIRPPRPRPPVPPQPPEVEVRPLPPLPGITLTGPVFVEVIDGDEMKLIVNKSMLAKLGNAGVAPAQPPVGIPAEPAQPGPAPEPQPRPRPLPRPVPGAARPAIEAVPALPDAPAPQPK